MDFYHHGFDTRLLQKMSSFVITGSSGTVGTALAKALLNKGHDVTGVDIKPNSWSDAVDDCTEVLDLNDKKCLKNLPTDIDLVIHLAANARVHKLVQEPRLAKENIDLTYNILEYARKNEADLLFSSSREVYGNNGQIIYDENDTHVDECESPYTASKVSGEALVKSYNECYDINTGIVRYSNVYGKYDSSDRVIPLFISQAYTGQDLVVYGEDKILDFTYLKDCVDGTVRLVENFNKISGTSFNIASGEGTSLLELANIITDKLNSDSSINIGENRTGEVGRYVADISKARKIIGFDPEYDIESGLEQTIEWYLNNEKLLNNVHTS